VADAGLELVDVRFLFASLAPLIFAVRAAQRRFPRREGPRPDSDIRVPPAPLNALLNAVLAGEAVVGSRLPMPFGSSLLVSARKPGPSRIDPALSGRRRPWYFRPRPASEDP
jgi:hypothetical protein